MLDINYYLEDDEDIDELEDYIDELYEEEELEEDEIYYLIGDYLYNLYQPEDIINVDLFKVFLGVMYLEHR